ncbi:MAG: ATP-binding protein [Bacteroidota bacterium]
MKTLTYILVLTLAFASPVLAQDFVIQSKLYTEEDGLLHREINAINQDDEGFLWLGCPKGLMRYDGYTFKSYLNDSLPGLDYGVWRIRKDFKGYLWLVGYERNILLFHPQKHEFISFEDKFGIKVNPTDYEIDINVISGPQNSLAYLSVHPDGSHHVVFYHPDSDFVTIDVSHLGKALPRYITKRGTIWCYLKDKFDLVEITPSGEVLNTKEFDAQLGWNQNGQLDHRIYWETSENTINCIEDCGFEKMAFPTRDFFSEVYFSNYYPNSIVLNKTPVLAMDGQFFDIRNGSYISELSKLNSSVRSFRSTFEDDNGLLWMGGNFGLTRIFIRENQFSNYLQVAEEYEEKHFPIRGIYEKQGNLFAQSEVYGLFYQDLSEPHSEPEKIYSSDWGNFAIFPSSDEELLLGRRNELVYFYPELLEYPDQLSAFKKINSPRSSIWSIFEEDSGRLWLGSTKGLFFKNIDSEDILKYNTEAGFDDLDKSHIVYINDDSNGNIWICSTSGLFKMEPDKGITRHFHNEFDGEDFLPAKKFFHFYEDKEGIFWLGTSENGLIKWDPKKHKYQVFSKEEGLPNDVIYAVYEDKRERLWMSSDYGIIAFDKETNHVTSFQNDDGLPHNEFNRVSHFQNDKGHLFFGSLNGLTTFDPNTFEMGDSIRNIPLSITRFQQFSGKENKLLDLTGELIQSHKIKLKPDDRYFQLEFALLNFTDSKRNNYAWKIDKIDKEWSYQSERSIRLSRLPYGNQKLLVKAQTADGKWSSDIIEIAIDVVRPFYIRYWFLGSLSLLILGFGSAFYFGRINYLKKRQLELEALVEKRTARIKEDKLIIEQQAEELKMLDTAKSRFFANVSHELRTPLTLILGPLGTLLKRSNLKNQDFTLVKLMQQNANHLLSLINEILDLSKLESGKLTLNLEPVSFYPFIKRLLAGYESHVQAQSINLVFHYKADQYLQLMIDEKKFEKVFNNLLANALKFTPKGGRIEVMVEDLGNNMVLKVLDTGVGIHPYDLPNIFNRYYQSNQPDAPTEGGTGIGLAICYEFAHLFEGQLEVESELEKGSTFTFTFPKKEVMGVHFEDLSVTNVMEKEAENEIANGIMAAEYSGANTTRFNVLIVEDNSGLRNYLKIILSDMYDVQTAVNGMEALDIITNATTANQPIDLIVSDIMMPVMDGIQLLEVLKSKDYLRHIPIIMLTARAELSNKLKALRIGVDDYMIKPFEEEELLARIKNLLLNYKTRKTVFVEQDALVVQSATNPLKEQKPPIISANDQQWLVELEQIVKDNAGKFGFKADSITSELAISRSKLFRKIKTLTGLTANQYINAVRFNLAKSMLESSEQDSVKATAFAVGFKDVEYFSRQFKKEFGRLPSSYL